MSNENEKKDPFAIQPVRTIGNMEVIPDPDGDDGEPNYLSLEEKLGIVEIELSKPFAVSDTAEPASSIMVQAPSNAAMKKGKGNLYTIMERCVVGWTPSDITKFFNSENTHGRDNLRVQKIIRHFLA